VPPNARLWAGVDVGGRRKGFDAVVVHDSGILEGPTNLKTPADVVTWLRRFSPRVAALDSPRRAARPGERSRSAERELNRSVCGIRWTPPASQLDGNAYYEWIVHGFELYAALNAVEESNGWKIIEVFPTASWTRWAGERGTKTRAEWTKEALDGLALTGLPSRRLSQDDRDAIAAALTARLYDEGRTDAFGDIVVPRADDSPDRLSS
jgi:predicted nuclease with RNAse H fold